MYIKPFLATFVLSSPKERLFITGLLGFTFTSTTGAKFTCTPIWADCSATETPSLYRRLSF